MQPTKTRVDLYHQHCSDVQEFLATNLYRNAHVLKEALLDKERIEHLTNWCHDEQGSHCASAVCSHTRKPRREVDIHDDIRGRAQCD